MKTDQTKQTTTTLESILSGKDLTTFNSAKETWKQATKNTLKNLANMADIGRALNLLYDKGDQKNLKREAITDMVRAHFKGLDRRERSDYRKLAEDYVQVKLFVEFTKIKSCNPSYLINAWRKAMTEDRNACAFIETELSGGVDAQGEVMSEKVVKAPTKKEMTLDELPIKMGFDNIVTPEPLTTEELAQQLGAVINQVKTAFNTGRFDKDESSLLTIENQLTSCLQHINSCEAEDNDLLQAVK